MSTQEDEEEGKEDEDEEDQEDEEDEEEEDEDEEPGEDGWISCPFRRAFLLSFIIPATTATTVGLSPREEWLNMVWPLERRAKVCFAGQGKKQ